MAWYHVRIYPLERDTTTEVEAKKRPDLAEVFRLKLRCRNEPPDNDLMVKARERALKLGWEIDPFRIGATTYPENGYKWIAS